MPTMRAIQFGKKSGPLELVERELPQPRRGEVRVKVQACGVCHSDVIAKEGLIPAVRYPIIPGHEIAGVSKNPQSAGRRFGRRVEKYDSQSGRNMRRCPQKWRPR